MLSQPVPRLVLLICCDAVKGEFGLLLKGIHPIEERKSGSVVALAAKKRPGFSGDEIRGEDLFRRSKMVEHGQGIGVAPIDR